MVLIIFVVLAVIGQAINVSLCLALDQMFSPTVGALTFVLLYMLVFAGAWFIAVRIAERLETQPVKQLPSSQKLRRPVLNKPWMSALDK